MGKNSVKPRALPKSRAAPSFDVMDDNLLTFAASEAASKDEPRRSSRATKGQNSDRWQEILDASRDNLINPESVNGDGATDQGDKMTNINEDDENAGEDAIRCVCGQNDEVEDDDRTFVQCETCTVWQHAPCVGLNTKRMPDQYFCEQCRPDLHGKLLKRMQASVKPKARVMPDSKTNERKRKRSIKAQANDDNFSDDGVTDDGASDNEIARKQRSVSLSSVSDAKSDYQENVKVKARRLSTTKKEPVKKAKTSKSKVQPVYHSGPFTSLDEIEDDTRKTIAKLLIRDVAKALEMATSQEGYKLKAKTKANDEADRIGFAAEFALHEALFEQSDAGAKYKNQYRQIAFNLKDPKNPSLRRRVLDGSVSVAQLATMSSEDMANPELKAMAEQVREEGLKQSVLVQETGPRIRRTHKGEELVEGPEVNDSITESSSFPVGRRHDSDQDSSSPAASPSPSRDGSSSPEATKNSQSPSLPGSSFKHDRRPSHNTPIMPDVLDDDAELHVLNEIAHPSKLPADPVWHGQMVMQRISNCNAQATLVGAPDEVANLVWSEILTSVVTIDGRLDKKSATQYLVHQRYSQSKIVVAVKIEAQPGGNNQAGIDALYQYFTTKNRYGVIKSGQSRIRDGYIVPLAANEALPEFLDVMDNKTLPSHVTEPLLLAVLVVEKHPAANRKPSVTAPVPAAIPVAAPAAPSSDPAIPRAPWQQPQSMPAPQQPVAPTNDPSQQPHQVYLAQEQQRQLAAFLQANPELASNQQIMSSPPLLAALLENWLRSNGMR
ncbi:transcription factor S-II, central domain-domain-containing protein [Protomyces lactucae-debilis]|uniref:Transcription factor BYE1 n=1 Tax=Protomyces lactucae-debilis TaxID=2754530 RepID=A0A1Y2FBY8_PROLT|nr:transcription factor S-II, central domain-containing protein [Protomyces lactucae-debilis]ORY81440.1 transcription factor S-II, central domain-domain-containing protein [Protomyces lactucae-debilis]